MQKGQEEKAWRDHRRLLCVSANSDEATVSAPARDPKSFSSASASPGYSKKRGSRPSVTSVSCDAQFFLSIDHRADWMPYDSSLHNLIASLRMSSSYDRQNDQRGAINGWPFNFFIKVEVITVKQSIQKIEESSTIEIFVDRPAWLPHLGKQP